MDAKLQTHHQKGRLASLVDGTVQYGDMPTLSVTMSLDFEVKILISVWWCQLGNASGYLCKLHYPIFGLVSPMNLWSTGQGELVVPFAQTSAMQHRTFSVVRQSMQNRVPLDLCFCLSYVFGMHFLQTLEDCFFHQINIHHGEMLYINILNKWTTGPFQSKLDILTHVYAAELI